MKEVLNKFAFVLMVLMLVFPAKFYVIKIVLLIILFVCNFHKIRLTKQISVLWFCLVVSTLFGFVVGFLKGTPYFWYGMTTGVIWPTLALFIALPVLNKSGDYDVLLRYLFYVHSFIIAYDVVFAMSIIYGFHFINLYPEVDIGFSYYGIFSRLNFDDNLNVLTFTIPIYFFVWLCKYEIGVSRLFQTIMLLLAVFLIVIGGRRSIMLVFVLAPLCVLLSGSFMPREFVAIVKKRLLIYSCVLFCFVCCMLLLDSAVVNGYVDHFFKAFDSKREAVRFVQAEMLWNSFLENFLFGTGNGAMFYEESRSIWEYRYELTYLIVLANRGIVGGMLFFWGVFGVVIVGVRLFVREYDMVLLFFVFGYFFVLLANATNPVLSSFDLMFPLYVCYAKINSVVLEREDKAYACLV